MGSRQRVLRQRATRLEGQGYGTGNCGHDRNIGGQATACDQKRVTERRFSMRSAGKRWVTRGATAWFAPVECHKMEMFLELPGTTRLASRRSTVKIGYRHRRLVVAMFAMPMARTSDRYPGVIGATDYELAHFAAIGNASQDQQRWEADSAQYGFGWYR